MNTQVSALIEGVAQGNFKLLARAITIVENELEHSIALLQALTINYTTPVIGITGPPGAGKSTLVNSLIAQIVSDNKRVAVVAVDPTSPFNYGSLLGDRIRMIDFFNNPNVYIRSLATRGSLGGLSEKIMEVTDVLRASNFDYIFIETVGVGQSEVEIAGLADVTVVVLVPEAGDEVQGLKAGIMEIANVFVVNKADRPGAQVFANNLRKLTHERADETPVLTTTAHLNEGVAELIDAINQQFKHKTTTLKHHLLVEKIYRLIQKQRMKDVSRVRIEQQIKNYTATENALNPYKLVERFK
ncbi:MAG: methylmalonyl Co-A mutase-associated GTPase MeaB [Bacteroidia bacterium]